MPDELRSRVALVTGARRRHRRGHRRAAAAPPVPRWPWANAASKAGLHGLLHFVAAREAGHGITVNAIAPALIEETSMLPNDPGDLASRIPAGRLGRPAEAADLAVAVLRNGYPTN